MSVKDIEKAITELPPSDIAELAQWFEDFQEQTWDKQIGQDSKSGKFASLIEQAKAEYAAGKSRPL